MSDTEFIAIFMVALFSLMGIVALLVRVFMSATSMSGCHHHGGCQGVVQMVCHCHGSDGNQAGGLNELKRRVEALEAQLHSDQQHLDADDLRQQLEELRRAVGQLTASDNDQANEIARLRVTIGELRQQFVSQHRFDQLVTRVDLLTGSRANALIVTICTMVFSVIFLLLALALTPSASKSWALTNLVEQGAFVALLTIAGGGLGVIIGANFGRIPTREIQ